MDPYRDETEPEPEDERDQLHRELVQASEARLALARVRFRAVLKRIRQAKDPTEVQAIVDEALTPGPGPAVIETPFD